VHYAQLAQMVAEPAEQLGLDVSIPNQSGYSTEGALALGQHVAAQLRLRSTRLSSLFDFVWRIMLLLFAAEDAHEPPQEERTVMESTLVRAARNAGLLDKQSEELIHTIAWEDLEFWGQATQFLNSVLVTRRIEPAELGS